MTDEEVRARLDGLVDRVSMGLASLNALQMGVILLFFQDGSVFSAWCGSVVLGIIPVMLAVRAFVRSRNARLASEELRRKYARNFTQCLAYARMAKGLLWVWLGLTVLNGYLLFAGKSSETRVWGASMAIMGLLMSTTVCRQWKVVLPRLERESAEFREGALA